MSSVNYYYHYYYYYCLVLLKRFLLLLTPSRILAFKFAYPDNRDPRVLYPALLSPFSYPILLFFSLEMTSETSHLSFLVIFPLTCT